MSNSTFLKTALSQVSCLPSELNAAEWTKAVVEIIQTQLNVYFVGLFMVNPRQQTLNFLNGSGETGRDLLNRGWSFSIEDHSLWTSTVRSNEIVLCDWQAQETFHTPLPLKANSVTSLTLNPGTASFSSPLLPGTIWELLIPLQEGDNVVGLLDLIGDDTSLSLDSGEIGNLLYLASFITAKIREFQGLVG
jgi:hypothetical protein